MSGQDKKQQTQPVNKPANKKISTDEVNKLRQQTINKTGKPVKK